jgi:hypothetical protein
MVSLYLTFFCPILQSRQVNPVPDAYDKPPPAAPGSTCSHQPSSFQSKSSFREPTESQHVFCHESTSILRNSSRRAAVRREFYSAYPSGMHTHYIQIQITNILTPPVRVPDAV